VLPDASSILATSTISKNDDPDLGPFFFYLAISAQMHPDMRTDRPDSCLARVSADNVFVTLAAGADCWAPTTSGDRVSRADPRGRVARFRRWVHLGPRDLVAASDHGQLA